MGFYQPPYFFLGFFQQNLHDVRFVILRHPICICRTDVDFCRALEGVGASGWCLWGCLAPSGRTFLTWESWDQPKRKILVSDGERFEKGNIFHEKRCFFQVLCFNLSLVSWSLQSLGIYCGLAINFELISAVIFRIFSSFCWWIWPIPGHFLGIWLRSVSPRLLWQGVQQQSGDAVDAGHGKLGNLTKWAFFPRQNPRSRVI